jgi:hypothetical protein
MVVHKGKAEREDSEITERGNINETRRLRFTQDVVLTQVISQHYFIGLQPNRES